MASVSLLAASFAAFALAFIPWTSLIGSERQPIPDGSPIQPSASLLSAIAPTDDRVAQTSPDGQEAPRSDSYCLTCHDDPSFNTRFGDGQTLQLYVDVRELRDSAHALLSCLTCHEDHEVCPPERAESLDFAAYRAEATERCIRCHLGAAGDYAGSVHGQPILTGVGEGATCNDCHSLELSGHTVGRVGDPRLQLVPESLHRSCGRCHEEELESYRQTSHSKVARFGDPARPATCTTCHGDHATKVVDDPEEPLTVARLTTVCQRCHAGADEAYASGWPGHSSSSAFVGVKHLQRFIIFSMMAGLSFGLVHMSLDFFRRLTSRRQDGWADPESSENDGAAAAGGNRDALERPVAELHSRAQYALIVGSILVLALTGLPQKFGSLELSQAIMDAAGGIETLRLIHRTAGGALIFAGLYHLAFVLYTVLVLRVLTPLHMIPSPRDFRDASQMVLYFLALRRRPAGFERPSYFRKLDYWLMVWALALMGSSGLVLLFPVRAARLLSLDVVLAALEVHSTSAVLVVAWALIVHALYLALAPTLPTGRETIPGNRTPPPTLPAAANPGPSSEAGPAARAIRPGNETSDRDHEADARERPHEQGFPGGGEGGR